MSGHQPGSLKQANKKHKGSTSKRQNKVSLGAGKVETAKISVLKPKKGKTNNDKIYQKDSRINRIHKLDQLRQNKKSDVWLSKRIGSENGAPKIIGIIPLSNLSDPVIALQSCLMDATWSNVLDNEIIPTNVHAFYSQHKSRCTFVAAKHDLFSALDVAKVADIILFVVDSQVDNMLDLVDSIGRNIISAIKATGCPEMMCCVTSIDNRITNMEDNMISKKQIHENKKVVYRHLQDIISSDMKINSSTEGSHLVRNICNTTPKDIHWRKIRSYMMSNDCQLEQQLDGKVSLKIGGYLKGRPMSINSLVHVVGVGAGRIDSFEIPSNSDPFDRSHKDEGKSLPSFMIHSDGEKQEDLTMEACTDGLMGEQTWPTEDEMNGIIDDSDGLRKNMRNLPSDIPEGMSSYQADWLVNNEGEWEDDLVDPDNNDNSEMGVINEEDNQSIIEDQEDDMGTEFGGSVIDSAMNVNAAIAEKRRLQALVQDEKQFPDEVDTPGDQSARHRFARYRALQSFWSSPWHPKENLPHDYSKLYQFQNFGGAQKRVLTEGKQTENLQNQYELHKGKGEGKSKGRSSSFCENDSMTTNENNAIFVPGTNDSYVSTGQFMYIIIKDLSPNIIERLANDGFLSFFSLLTHENKLSVLHFSLQRTSNYNDPIKSKEDMIFQAGFRSFKAKPIYSESNLNCDKHKLERYLLPDRFSVASIYAPVTFLPCPLLLFKELDNGETILVATGTLMSVDPDRIILKKVILTGIPIRVRKRMAVVKHMLYDPLDVRWFKPAELQTKSGLRGHIKETVGTHGLFKALFSGIVAQNDTILLVLYKRIFPKLPENNILIVR